MEPRVIVDGLGLVSPKIRDVLGHRALDVLRGTDGAIVFCVVCGGHWLEGGIPPQGCLEPRAAGKPCAGNHLRLV